MNKLISILVLNCITLLSMGQTIGGFEAKLKWNELKADQSTIIYNPEFEAYVLQAQGIILRLQKMPFNVGNKIKKINIVFRSQSILSNAYVGLAPFKSEFFLNPSQNNFTLGSLPWTYLLSIHEYQHVLQFSNTLYGPTKWAYWFGGDLTWGALTSLTIPNWFFEGDAVRAETAYSNQGRGRIPYFLNGFRQMAYANSNYSYAKARNGSLKDNVPSHYPLGYLMIKHGKEKYGDAFWSKVLKETAQFKSVIYPFSKAIKRNTKQNVKSFYVESLEAYKKELNIETQNITYNGYQNQSRKEIKANTRLDFYQKDPKTEKVYLSVSSFDKPAHIEQVIDSTKREKVHLQGIRQSNYFDVYDNQILYAAKYVHPRWNLKDYSDLVIYDLKTKKLKRISNQKRIFSPNFIQQGSKIIAIEMDQYLIPHLIIFDSEGERLKSFENKEKYYLSYPKEISKNEILVCLRDSLGRTNLSIFNLQEQKHQLLLPWTFHQIGIPEHAAGQILFSASFSGIDHLYQLELEGKAVKQITFGIQSHYQPQYDSLNKCIYFQAFNLHGNQILYSHLDSIENKPFSIKPLNEIIPISFAKKEQLISVDVKGKNLQAETYSKGKHLINFHSWTLNAIDPQYEFSILSENVLGNFATRVGTSYNRNENGIGYFANFLYSQFYPVVGLQLSRINRSTLASSNKRYYWNETEILTSISIPFDFSNSGFNKILDLRLSHSYAKLNYESEAFTDQNISSLKGRILAQATRLKARRNIFTHLGVFANWSYENSLYHSDLSLLSLKNSIALPGFFANHNTVLDLDFQINENQSQFNYTDNFNYARGYQSVFHEDVYKLGLNYHFPLFYPDRGALGIVYLLRTRMNLFLDYSQISATNRVYHNNSLGGEIIVDLKLFNAFNGTIGFRLSHLLNNNPSGSNAQTYELFIPINRF